MEPIRAVKVFSATRRWERDAIGDRVTSWITDHPELRVAKAVVALSSDEQFHCVSIVLICEDDRPRTGIQSQQAGRR